MSNTDETALQRLYQLRDDLKKRLSQVEGTIEQLHGTNKWLTYPIVTTPQNGHGTLENFPLERLKDLTQAQGMIALAKHCGGLLRTNDLKDALIRAGRMKNSQNAYAMSLGLITNSEKFDKVRPGLYRLKDDTSTSAAP